MNDSQLIGGVHRPKDRVPLYSWYVAVMLMLVQILAVTDRYLISVIVEPLKHDLALSDTQIGLLTGTAFGVVFSVFSIPFGRIADVWNRRAIITCGLLFWSCATMLGAFVHSFNAMFLARLGVGLGEASLIPAAISLVTSYFTRNKLTRGLAVFSAGNSLGRASAFIGGGAILASLAVHGRTSFLTLLNLLPWQGVLFVGGALGIILAAIFFFTVREPPRISSDRESQGIGHSLRHLNSHRAVFSGLFLLHGCSLAIVSALAVWSVSLFARNYGVPIARGSAMVGLTSLVCGPLGVLAGGWVTGWLDRYVRGATLVVGLASLVAAAMGSALFFVAINKEIAFAAYIITYTAIVFGGPSYLANVQLVTPPQHRGLMTALYLATSTLIGSGAGPLLIGILNDYVFRSGDEIALSLGSMTGLLVAIAVPLISLIRPKFNDLATQVRTDQGVERTIV